LECTAHPHHLVVWDNGVENRNLGALWNDLIERMSKGGDIICLLNSDTTVTSGWLGKLVEALVENPAAGAVGPTTDHSYNAQSGQPPAADKEVINFGATYPDQCLSGFCLAFTHDAWLAAGKFPSDWGFYGQETALLIKMMHAGMQQLWRRDVFVHHEGGGSVNLAVGRGEEINELQERRAARARVVALLEELSSES
jgi:GT2 family glycosyltransferase